MVALDDGRIGRSVGVKHDLEAQVMSASLSRRLFGEPSVAPIRVGRFVVLDRIGSGGMGTVLRAYDPELDRKVALKVLRPRTLLHAEVGARRLQREAMAMARLSHPNVVTIHEVGTSESQTFLAMELVDGADLARWIREHTEPTQARFDAGMALLLQAGRGLAAAHSAGLIHRDFKPSNVLVGKDGRARVADFGLVRAANVDEHDADTSVVSNATLDGSQRDRGRASTLATGALIGTPRYMAPEQRRGDDVDARCDQFSFCATAWEVLLGDVPWPDGWRDQPPVVPTRAPRATGWVVSVLARGLATDPAARWPDMNALLAALADDPRRRRRRWIAAAGVAALIASGAGVVAYRRAHLCDDGPAALAQTWSPERAAALAAHVGAMELADTSTWARAEARMSAFADDWLATWETVCDAGRRRSTITETSMDAALGCLEVRRIDLDAVLEVLEAGERATTARAAELAFGLRRPSDCADDPHAGHAIALSADDASRDELVQMVQELARARSLGEAGDWREARTRLATLAEALDGAASAQLQLRVAAARADAAAALTLESEAAELAEAAYWDAIRIGDDGMAASLARLLADNAGRRTDATAGMLWLSYARAFAERAGVDDVERALLEAADARVLSTRGDFRGAIAALQRGLAFGESAWGPRHPRNASIYNGLSALHRMLREMDEAERYAREGLAIVEDAYGPDSLAAAGAAAQLAAALSVGRKHDEALALERRVVELRVAWLGPGNIEVAHAFGELATTASIAGRDLVALEAYRMALALYAGHDANADAHLLTRYNLAQVLGRLRRFDEALPVAIAAADAYEKALGPDHPRVAMALRGIAYLRMQLDQRTEARRLFERAAAIYEKTLGAGHPDAVSIRLMQIIIDHDDGAEPRVTLPRAEQLLRDIAEPANEQIARLRGQMLVTLGQIQDRHGRRGLAPTRVSRHGAAPEHP